MPAQQCFQTDDFVIRKTYDRLKMQLELAAFQSATQICLQCHTLYHLLTHARIEKLITRFAVRLSLIHRSIGIAQQMLSLLGVGTQVGVLLPFSRKHESEADAVGLTLMARAGFDPRASVALWQNMARVEGGKAPSEFMSTHPATGTRIRDLQGKMNNALAIYNQARAQGRRPACRK